MWNDNTWGVLGLAVVLGLIAWLQYRGLSRLSGQVAADKAARQAAAQEARTAAAQVPQPSADYHKLVADLDAWKQRYYTEHGAMQTQLINLQAQVRDLERWTLAADLYMDASDGVTHGVVPAIRPTRRRKGTGPLVPGPALLGAVTPRDQAALLDILLNASWVAGSPQGREQLLVDLPKDFRNALSRAEGPRADVRNIIDLAVTWGTPPGQPSILECLLETAKDLLGESEPGQALRAWRERITGQAAPPPPA